MPTISLQNYTTQFQRPISIPVKEDQSMVIPVALRNSLAPGTNFVITLDDAVQAADRYLSIHGNPPNPVQIVDEWTNILRWELSNYWASPGGNWYGVQGNGPLTISPEHPKRSGELLAQGLAILFLENRLNISRSRFFFLEGNEARPDFFIRPEKHTQRAVLLKNRRIMGLEVRSRNGISSVPSKDKPQLHKKKNKIANTLIIYCSYGEPSPTKKLPRTKLILADPPGEDAIASDNDVATIMLGHYLGVTSRLGLWNHRDELKKRLTDASLGWDPPTEPIKALRLLPRETFNNIKYIGRFFNDLVMRYDQGELPEEERRNALETGYFGPVFFNGIREDVLKAVGTFDWRYLESFFDEKGVEEQHGSTSIATDGTIRVEYNSVSRDSIFWKAIANCIRNPKRK